MSKNIINLLLILIILFGFTLRVYNVSNNPSGFFADEASISYNAYTILNFGTDEFGESFPILFKSFGNYRPGISIFSTVPFVYIFGLNEFSSRITAVIAGTILIYVIYLLFKEFSSSRIGALFAAFLTAISPWAIHFSRTGHENIHLPLHISIAVLLFLIGLRKKNNILIVFSFLFFSISLYTYVASYIVTPLLLLCLLVVYLGNLRNINKGLIVGIVVFLISLTPLARGVKEGYALTRFTEVSNLNSTSNNEEYKSMLSTYFNNFSPTFLFIKGDIDYPGHFITRFSSRGQGQFYFILLPLSLLGFLYFIKKKDRRPLLLIVFWLIIFPLPSTLSSNADGGGPMATRSIFGLVPIIILISAGFVFITDLVSNKLVKSFLIAAVCILLLFLTHKYLLLYHNNYPLYSSDYWGWQFGPRDAINYFLANQNDYDEMYLEGKFNGGHIFLNFYDPENLCRNKCNIGGIESYNPQKRQLFVLSVSTIEEIAHNYIYGIKEILYYPNNKPAFVITKLKRKESITNIAF